jgi:tRNA nucleotidyltransferase (CCA-adding enzyme)
MNIQPARIRKLLGKEAYAHIRSLGATAERSGHPCYLVGGIVRDIILNVRSLDIDLVSDGAITWVPEIMKNRSVKKIIRSQFSTVKVLFTKGFIFDIARARKETYPAPASLPVIEPGSLVEDSARRDFTINTLLMDISETRFGLIRDFCGGIADLQDGIIRVLHERSFVDDPTRIFRAVKFKHRLAFRFDQQTARLMNSAIRRRFIQKLTPQRIRREFFLMLGEETWDLAVKDLKRMEILKQMGLYSQKPNRIIKKLKAAELEGTLLFPSSELTRLLSVTAPSSKAEILRFSSRTGLRKTESSLLLSVLGGRKDTLRELSKPGVSNSHVFALLEDIPDEGLHFLFLIASKRARKRIRLYAKKLKATRLLITGNDLKKIGIKEGPSYSRILRMVLMEKLDGKTGSKKAELASAKKFAARNR